MNLQMIRNRSCNFTECGIWLIHNGSLLNDYMVYNVEDVIIFRTGQVFNIGNFLHDQT